MRPFIALAFCLSAISAAAQPTPPPNIITPSSAKAPLSAQQLQHLVASIALYPDPVLTDILAASTYPAQVVEAQRLLADPANAGLRGDALRDLAASHGWDDSVMALLAFPQLIQQMDANLEFTEYLGRAFLNQPADVLAAVQTLRQLSQAAGTLANNSPDATVVDAGGVISIEPPSPEQVYLPSYNDACAFGPNSACGGAADLTWASAITLSFGGQVWGEVDWAHHAIRRGARSRWGGQHDADFWSHSEFRPRSVPARGSLTQSRGSAYGRTMLYGHAVPNVRAAPARPAVAAPALAPRMATPHGFIAHPAIRPVAPPAPVPHISGSIFHH